MEVQYITTSTGEEMAVIPKDDYETLLAALEDKLDLIECKQIIEDIKSSGEETFPFELIERLTQENSIRVMREYRKFTLEELANKADINKGYLSSLENDKRKGSNKVREKIAVALSLDTDFFID